MQIDISFRIRTLHLFIFFANRHFFPNSNPAFIHIFCKSTFLSEFESCIYSYFLQIDISFRIRILHLIIFFANRHFFPNSNPAFIHIFCKSTFLSEFESCIYSYFLQIDISFRIRILHLIIFFANRLFFPNSNPAFIHIFCESTFLSEFEPCIYSYFLQIDISFRIRTLHLFIFFANRHFFPNSNPAFIHIFCKSTFLSEFEPCIYSYFLQIDISFRIRILHLFIFFANRHFFPNSNPAFIHIFCKSTFLSEFEPCIYSYFLQIDISFRIRILHLIIFFANRHFFPNSNPAFIHIFCKSTFLSEFESCIYSYFLQIDISFRIRILINIESCFCLLLLVGDSHKALIIIYYLLLFTQDSLFDAYCIYVINEGPAIEVLIVCEAPI